jgi:ribulose-5-phosphate 4-epimerase/fuculose-1-phosphate aldolase
MTDIETSTATTPVAHSEEELRRHLAACCRLIALEGWGDGIANHVTARIPGTDEFLLNPFGKLFEEITASDLQRVDETGAAVDPSPWPVNRSAFIIHSAVHMARPDISCVIHLHTTDAVAVSALECGLLPLNQTAMVVLADGRLTYHDYEGPAFNLAERERLEEHLGSSHVMMLRNHGTLATGPSIAKAFSRMYQLQWACSVQVKTLAMGSAVHQPSSEARATTEAFGSAPSTVADDLLWPALLRKLDRIDPTYSS